MHATVQGDNLALFFHHVGSGIELGASGRKAAPSPTELQNRPSFNFFSNLSYQWEEGRPSVAFSQGAQVRVQTWTLVNCIIFPYPYLDN